MPDINICNVDCMELMAYIPNQYYDLAIVDPPYGLNVSYKPFRHVVDKANYKRKKWDDAIPSKEYFDELRRVSKNQIIWGGNYYMEHLPNTQCYLIWDKKQPFDLSMAMCEMAWTSFKKPAKIFYESVRVVRNKIHPTQKPVSLYKWLLTHYANKGDKILDTHGGSASIAIACYDLSFDLDLCELDEEHFKSGKKRFEEHVNKSWTTLKASSSRRNICYN